MFSEHEAHRLRAGMLTRRMSTHEWRIYFSYLLGRYVALQEVDEFLTQEAHGRR